MPDLVGGAVRSAMRRLCRKQGRSAAVIAHRGRFHCDWRLDMVAARGRRRGCCGGKRYHERGSQGSGVWQAMVAGLAAGILALCLSQSALAQTAPRPSKPDEAAHKPATQKGLTQTPATQGAVPKPPAAAQPGRPPDLVYGAFQRGYFLTAFALATNRVTNAADAKAMTLLGELYANGLGVAQDDQRAAEWYRLAAARGDSNAMFALPNFCGSPRRAAAPMRNMRSARFTKRAAACRRTCIRPFSYGTKPRSPTMSMHRWNMPSRSITATGSRPIRKRPPRYSAKLRSAAVRSLRTGWHGFWQVAAAPRSISPRRRSGT